MIVQWKILTKMDGTRCKIHENINSLYLIKILHLSFRWRCLISSSLQIYRDISDRVNCWQIDKYRTPTIFWSNFNPSFLVANSRTKMTLSENIDYTAGTLRNTSQRDVMYHPYLCYYGFYAHAWIRENVTLWSIDLWSMISRITRHGLDKGEQCNAHVMHECGWPACSCRWNVRLPLWIQNIVRNWGTRLSHCVSIRY